MLYNTLKQAINYLINQTRHYFACQFEKKHSQKAKVGKRVPFVSVVLLPQIVLHRNTGARRQRFFNAVSDSSRFLVLG